MIKPRDKWYLWRETRYDGTHEWVLQWPRSQNYWPRWGPIRIGYDTFDEARLRVVSKGRCP